MTPTKTTKTEVEMVIRNRKTVMKDGIMTMSGIGEPSVFHALVVIFLEFFAWGLLTMPIISVLNATFPDHTFLMNGLIMGIKGILSFLSAPLIGALSDVWGRKFFLLVTVFFTCAPIPLMTINTWWFFAMISISGVFAVTFSIVFAYVADVTTEAERSRAYGLVSATFAASMVISPALGAYLMDLYGEALVVAAATAVAVLDVFFIMVAVPESLPEKVRPSGWGPAISWEQADPFAALRKVGAERTVLMLCVAVFLSYLPEAGQYSCIFVYLKLVMGFGVVQVAIFIAIVGVLSIGVQVVLGFLMRSLGAKHTIMVGLLFEMLQLMWYGFGSRTWMMWAAGVLAALGSLTYPAISAYVSVNSRADRQGVVQGMVTGVRGLCNGLGPAMFGVIFYLFHVDLNEEHATAGRDQEDKYVRLVPGPPFVLGALLVICALLVAAFLPEDGAAARRASPELRFEVERGRRLPGPLSPLMAPESAAL
ncbi:hippocampus abundant transcript 1 protein [Pectinophora gossypiella]|uniref:hippocampus abundant transcript 1 protein n=1 Tax=Pectinophora gossypiella TaxID=13191 RepID=UPI00214F3591|nr:hippocampus abundant transcript 1 protein [Pectinophora gossypiella]